MITLVTLYDLYTDYPIWSVSSDTRNVTINIYFPINFILYFQYYRSPLLTHSRLKSVVSK